MVKCQCWSWLTPNNLTDYAKAQRSFDKTGHHPDCPLGAKKRPRKKTGKRNTEEYRLQCKIVEILQVLENQGQIAGFYHWPNGMRVSIGQAVKFKKMGMKKGPWDLYVVSNYGEVIWMECKAQKGKLTEEQELFKSIHYFHPRMYWRTVRSVDDAMAMLKSFAVNATQNRVGERGDPSTADPREREPVNGTERDQVR